MDKNNIMSIPFYCFATIEVGVDEVIIKQNRKVFALCLYQTGAAMLSGVLCSAKAFQMIVSIRRAFVAV
jgi:hypothetical protein